MTLIICQRHVTRRGASAATGFTFPDTIMYTHVLTALRRTAKALSMARTRAFKSGNSQAVRLPAEIAFEDANIELEVHRTRSHPAGSGKISWYFTLRRGSAIIDATVSRHTA